MSRHLDGTERRANRASAHRDHRRAVTAARVARSVPRVPATELRTGVVVEAVVAFDDRPRESKRRPAVVLGMTGERVLVAPCTTKLRAHPGQLRLRDLECAGLAHPSAVLLRTEALDRSSIVGIRGELSDRDWQRLSAVRAAISG